MGKSKKNKPKFVPLNSDKLTTTKSDIESNISDTAELNMSSKVVEEKNYNLHFNKVEQGEESLQSKEESNMHSEMNIQKEYPNTYFPEYNKQKSDYIDQNLANPNDLNEHRSTENNIQSYGQGRGHRFDNSFYHNYDGEYRSETYYNTGSQSNFDTRPNSTGFGRGRGSLNSNAFRSNLNDSNFSNSPVPAPRIFINPIVQEQRDMYSKLLFNSKVNKNNKSSDYSSVISSMNNTKIDKTFYCVDCETPLARDISTAHKTHDVKEIDEGVKEVKKRKFDEISVEKSNILSMKHNEELFRKNSNAFEYYIVGHLLKNLKEMCQASNKSKDIFNEIDELFKKVPTDATNFADLLSVGNFQKEILSKKQKIESNCIPSWLVINLFKSSLGIIIAMEKEVFAVIEESSQHRYAKLILQGDRILIDCFGSHSINQNRIIVPYHYLEYILNKECSSAFMTLTFDKIDSFITLRTDERTFWGQQFLNLCLGLSGVTLLGSNFFRSAQKGLPGHHIWGGDYSNNNGLGGKTVLDKNNEHTLPLNYNPKVITKGLLAARPGYKDRSTIFRLYLNGCDTGKSNPRGSLLRDKNKHQTMDNHLIMDKHAFAQIDEGLEVLPRLMNVSDVNKIMISKIGRILKLA